MPRVILIVLMAMIAGTARSEPPFVAGFDRFARHGDVDAITGGRLLLTELNCTACHATDSTELKPKLGPRLNGAGDRLNSDWVRSFLRSPHASKPGTTMPDVLGLLPESKRERAIDALIAFLSTQHDPFPEIKGSGASPVPHEFWAKGDHERGATLYHQIGCVACHAPDAKFESVAKGPSDLDRMLEFLEPEDIEAMGLKGLLRPIKPVPHGDLATKCTPKALTHFLLDPAKVRPGGRMPNLKLSPVEAADITAYLFKDQKRGKAHDEPKVNPSLIAEGKRLFQDLSCINCHSVKEKMPAHMANSLSDLDRNAVRSCLNESTPGLPHYTLDAAQKAAITAALSEDVKPTSEDQLVGKMLRLNCFACHERGQHGGVGRDQRRYFETVGHVDLGDEGRIPPPLDGVGAKLRAEWIKTVLDGKGDVRPHMEARMPVFPRDAVAELPRLFATVDGGNSASEQEVFGKQSGLAEAGRTLMDTGCVSCHPMNGQTLPGVVGIDLAGVPGRIHPRWFRDFLHDPARLKARTRMPSFFPDGKSPLPTLLEGDVDRQIAALWVYLKEIDKQPLPEKLIQARSQDFELIPKDRPIVLRTFMKEAGTHALAVGFPQKVHFAFDTETGRLVQLWRGRFLDAHGTWFDRFTPPAIPLGKDVMTLPPGPPLAVLKDANDPWPSERYRFAGYRLDRDGVPTLLYRFRTFEIQDRLAPTEDGGLARRLTIKHIVKSEKPNLWLRANTSDSRLTVTITSGGKPTQRKLGSVTETIALIPMPDNQATIEMEYQWKRDAD